MSEKLKRQQAEWYRRWIENGDRRAHADLVESFAGLVYRAAVAAMPSGIPRDDLVSEGFAGVCDAIGRYDPERGALSGLVYHSIRQHLDRLSAEMSHVVSASKSRPERRLRWHLGRTMRKYVDEGYGDTRALELAARDLGVSIDHAACALARRHAVSMSASRPDDGDDDGGLEFADDTPPVEETLDQDRVRAVISEIVGGLDDRERRILTARVMTTPPVPLDTLGAELGVSRTRVSQILAGAIEKLRDEMAERELDLADLISG